MKPRLLNLLTALSLLVCVAVVALWVMSYTASAGNKRLRLDRMAARGLYLHTVELDAGAVEYSFYRRSYSPPATGAYVGVWHATMPLGVPGVGLLGVILLLVRRNRKLRARGAGVCVCCGYDLRATPDRCPECGSEASVTPSA